MKNVTQHKLLVCKINLRTQIRKKHKPPPERRIWKLRKPEVQEKYKKAVKESINSSTLQKHMLNQFGQKLNIV